MRRLAIVAVLMTAGCQSLDDIRTYAPVSSGTFRGQWRDVAECVNFKVGHVLLVDPAAKRAVVREPEGTWLTPTVHLYELSIRQIGEDRISVEARAFRTVWGTPHSAYETAWRAVVECTKPA